VTGCPPEPATTSQEAEASLVDTHSPAKIAQGTMDSRLLSPVQGQPLVTPPRERQTDVADAEACPERFDAITPGADVATPP
jgi:hypothetical protein